MKTILIDLVYFLLLSLLVLTNRSSASINYKLSYPYISSVYLSSLKEINNCNLSEDENKNLYVKLDRNGDTRCGSEYYFSQGFNINSIYVDKLGQPGSIVVPPLSSRDTSVRYFLNDDSVSLADYYQVDPLSGQVIYTGKKINKSFKWKCPDSNEYTTGFTIKTVDLRSMNSIKNFTCVYLNNTAVNHAEPFVKFSIEYIFKYFNDSSYGLIKDDMLANGIVSIARFVGGEHDEMVLRDNSSFQLKKFLPKSYMIKLAKPAKSFLNESRIEVVLDLIRNNSIIATTRLYFKLLSLNSLKLSIKQPLLQMRFNKNDKYVGQIPVDQVFTTGFSDADGKDWIDYQINHIRYLIQSSDFNLEPSSGVLSATNLKSDVLNVSVSDSRKLFEKTYFLINITYAPEEALFQKQITINESQTEFMQLIYTLESRMDILKISLNNRQLDLTLEPFFSFENTSIFMSKYLFSYLRSRSHQSASIFYIRVELGSSSIPRAIFNLRLISAGLSGLIENDFSSPSQFEKQLYEFEIDEDIKPEPSNLLISTLSTNCSYIDKYKIIGDIGGIFQAKLSNKNKIQLFKIGHVDYEQIKDIQTQLVAECDGGIMSSTKVSMQIQDLNDNKPIFMGPNQFRRFINNGKIRNNQICILAKDLDGSEKYSLLKYSIKYKSECLRIDLDEFTGLLTLYPIAYKVDPCEVNVLVNAWNYLDVRDTFNASANVKISVYNTKINSISNIFHRGLWPGAIIPINDPIPIVIDKCWMNNMLIPLDNLGYNYGIKNDRFYLFKPNQINDLVSDFQVDCKLVDFNWITFNFYLRQSESSNSQIDIDVYIQRLELQNHESRYIHKIDEIYDLKLKLDYSRYLITYKIVNSSDLINNLFELDMFNGVLKRSEKLNSNTRLILNHTDLIKIDVNAQIIDMMGLEPARSINVNIYVYIIENEDPVQPLTSSHLSFMPLLDKISSWYQGRLFKRLIKSINTTNYIKILKMKSFLALDKVHFRIKSVRNVFDYKEINHKRIFEILKLANNYSYLVVNSNNLQSVERQLYKLEMEACLTGIDKCRRSSFNVKLNIDLNVTDATFISDSFNFKYFNFKNENLNYNSSLSIIQPIYPLIDLNSLIKYSQLYKNVPKLKLTAPVDNSLLLDSINGHLYAGSLSNIKNVQIIMENNPNKSIIISFDRVEVISKIFKSINLEAVDESENEIVIFDLSEQLKVYDILKEKFDLKCVNVEQSICSRLIRINRIMNTLNLNRKLALAYKNINFLLDLGELRFSVNLEIQLSNDISEPLGFKYLIGPSTSILNLINTTEPNVKIFLIEKSRLLNNSIEIIRVKNMVTNNQVLALDYKLTESKDGYYLQLNDVLSLEQNQLYAFDIVYKQLQSSIYLIRFNPYDFKWPSNQCQLTKIKTYLNQFHMNKIRVNLTQLELDQGLDSAVKSSAKPVNSQIIENLYLINKIESKTNPNKNLMKYFKVNSDYFYFDSANDYEEQEFIDASLDVSVYKIQIDKVSLKVFNLIEFQIKIERFDWMLRKPSVSYLPVYYQNVKITKSDILKQIEHDRVLVYNFEQNMPWLVDDKTLVQFEIEYVSGFNLPFEINRQSGRLSYIFSDDRTAYDTNYEKKYKFTIILTDLNKNKCKFMFEFTLINDDPLVDFDTDKNRQIFNVIPSSNRANMYIGKINPIKTARYSSLNYSILDSNKSLFNLDKSSGFLYIKTPLIINDLNVLTVRIDGRIGEFKSVLFFIDVYVIIREVPELKTFKQIKFTSNEYNYLWNESAQIKSNGNLSNTRYIVINQMSQSGIELCDVNKLNGSIQCGLNSVDSSSMLNLMAFDKDDIYLNSVDFCKVIISFPPSTALIEDSLILGGSIFNLIHSYNTSNSSFIGNIYDMIRKDYNLTINPDKYRLFHSNLSDLFSLNSFNGDLILKKTVPYLVNELHHVSLFRSDSKFEKVAQIKLNLTLSDSMNNPLPVQFYLFNNNCSFLIDYEDLLSSSSEQYRIGSVSHGPIDQLSPPRLTFESEAGILNRSIYVNETNGDVVFIPNADIQLENIDNLKFTVLVRDFDTSDLLSKYECKINIDTSSKIYTNNSILIEKEIDSPQIGNVVVNLNDILFKNNQYTNEIDLDRKVPFEVDPFTGDLIVSGYINSTLYEFVAKIKKLKLKILIKIRVKQINSGLRFDKNLYQLTINPNDKNSSILAKLNASYTSERRILNRVLYRFYESIERDTLPIAYFKSLIKIHELTGELKMNPVQSLSDYSAYCNLIQSSRLNILLAVEAFNQFEESSFTSALINVKPDCSSLVQDYRFSEPFYLIRVPENTPIGVKIGEIKVFGSHDVTFRFCSNITSRIVDIDAITGRLFLKKSIDREDVDKYEYNVCATDANNLAIQTKILILVEDLNDNRPTIQFLSINAPQTDFLDLKIPIRNVTTGNKLKLFRFRTHDLDSGLNGKTRINLETSSMGIFSIRREWLEVTVDPGIFTNEMHKLRISAIDFGIPALQSQNIDIFIRFCHENQDDSIFDVNIPVGTPPGFKVLDLKPLFGYSYRYIQLKSSELPVFFNRTDGNLYTTQPFTNSIKIELTFIDEDSDFTLATIKLNPSKNETLEEEFKQIDMLLSIKTPIDSIVFDLSTHQPSNTILVLKTNEYFYVDSTSKRIRLRRNLTDSNENNYMTECFIYEQNSGKMSLIKLNMYFIERVRSSISFADINYYFDYYLASESNLIGQLELNMDNKNLIFGSLMENWSVQVEKSICLTSSISIRNVFMMDNLNLFVNDTQSLLNLNPVCSQFGLRIKASLSDYHKNFTFYTNIQVNINDLAEEKIKKQLEPIRKVYYSNITTSIRQTYTYNSISLFDLIRFEPKPNSQIIFKPQLLTDSKFIDDYHLNPINGILIVNLANISKNSIVKFEIICYTTGQSVFIIKKFYLNLFIMLTDADTVDYYFYIPERLVRYDLKPLQTQIDLNQFIYYSPTWNLTQTNLKFIIENQSRDFIPLEVDNHGLLTLNSEISFIQLQKFMNVQICTTDLEICDFIQVQINSPGYSRKSILKEYYKSIDCVLNLNYVDFNDRVTLLKLSSLTETSYDLYQVISTGKSNSSVGIDYENGLVYAIHMDRSDLSITLAYNSSDKVEIEFTVQSNLIMFEPRTGLQVDFYYLSYQPKEYYVGNLRPVLNLNGNKADLSFLKESNKRFRCEFWNVDASVEQMMVLNANCDLFVNTSFINKKKTDSLRVDLRAYDSKSVYRSIFYSVQVNLKKYDLNSFQSQSIYIEYSKIGQNNNSLASFYENFIKIKLNSVILDFDDQFIVVRSNKFNTNYQNLTSFMLNKYKRLIQQTFEIDINNLFSYESFCSRANQYYLCNMDSQNGSIGNYLNLIDSNSIILTVPQAFYSHNRSIIRFEKLNYLIYENLNFTQENYMNLDFFFKELSRNSENKLLFHLIFDDFKFITIGIEAESLFLIQNISAPVKTRIDFGAVNVNQIYRVQLQVTSRELSMNLYVNGQASSKINSTRIQIDQIRPDIKKLYIGGADEYLDNGFFYSDQIQMSNFKINHLNLFNPDTINYLSSKKQLIFNEQSSEELDNSSTCLIGSMEVPELKFRMRENYHDYLSIQQSRLNSSDSFNLTIIFSMDQLNQTSSKSYKILYTDHSSLLINQQKMQIEMKIDDLLIGWIGIDTKILNKLSILINRDRILFIRNDIHQEFYFKDNQNKYNFNIFMSKFITLRTIFDNITQVCVKDLYLNGERIAMDVSKYYYSEFPINKTSSKIKSRINSDNRDVRINSDLSNLFFRDNFKFFDNKGDDYPVGIIITIAVMSFVALVAIFSIVLNIYIKKNHTTIIGAAQIGMPSCPNNLKNATIQTTKSKFNSRNPLEISINSSCCHPSDSSSSSSFSGMTTTQSLSRNTFQSANYSTRKSTEKGIQLNCQILDLNQENYFEYDIPQINTQQKPALANDNAYYSCLFDLNDMLKLKPTLTWLPSYNQFRDVFSEFQMFPGQIAIEPEVNNNSNEINQSNSNMIFTTTATNYYNDYDKQTFV